MKNDVRYWQERLYKEERQGHIDSNYSVRIAHSGRRERFQLWTANKYEAAAKARAIYQSLVANGWDQTLGRFKAAKAPKKIDVTIGEFLSELRALHASRAKTIENYAGSLRTIAAWIAGLPAGGRVATQRIIGYGGNVSTRRNSLFSGRPRSRSGERTSCYAPAMIR